MDTMTKEISSAKVQDCLMLLVEATNNSFQYRGNRDRVTAIMTDCHDRNEAIRLGVAIVQQAIAQGYAKVIKSGDKRNDTTSNYKRDASYCINAAYPDYTDKVTITTDGKGAARTVSFSLKEKPAKTDADKLKNVLTIAFEIVNATPAEQSSLTERFNKLFEAEKARLDTDRTKAAEMAEIARAERIEAITARAKDALKGRGIKPTKGAITGWIAANGY